MVKEHRTVKQCRPMQIPENYQVYLEKKLNHVHW